MKVENILRKNRAVLLGGSVIQFDADGIAEVDDATGAKLLKLGGYRSNKPPAGNREPITEPEQPTSHDGTPALESLNPAQLKKLAKDRGIEIGDAAKKAELIELIEKAQA